MSANEANIKLKPTRSFYRDLAGLSSELQKRVWNKLSLFQTSPRHPSLRVKKIKGTRDIWELSVTREYRLTFQWDQAKQRIAILRRVGAHNILQNP